MYTKNPEDILFDDKYVIFNPIHTDLQYAATKANIEKLGQLTPVLIYKGKCIDGRHRVKAAKELGLQVICEDIPDDTKEEDIVIRCNTNVMSGRDYDNAQKAIQALRLVNEYSMKVVTAAKLMKVDRRLVSYASTIKGFGREDLLKVLLDGKKVQLADMIRPSRSLEVICKHVKAENEEQTLTVDDTQRVQFNPDAGIKTEAGKAWYYEKMEMLGIKDDDIQIRMDYAELANYKHQIEELRSKNVSEDG